MSVIQSVLFNVKYWTIQKAVEWILDHKLQAKQIDITEHYLRFRQISPASLKRNGYTEYATKESKENNIEFVIAYKPNSEIKSNSR